MGEQFPGRDVVGEWLSGRDVPHNLAPLPRYLLHVQPVVALAILLTSEHSTVGVEVAIRQGASIVQPLAIGRLRQPNCSVVARRMRRRLRAAW